MQRYFLRGQAAGREVGSLVLRYNLPSALLGSVDSEPPTAAGVTATIQRHAEGATRMLLEGYGSIVKSFRDQIDAQAELLAKHQAQQVRMFEMQEEMANRMAEREQEYETREELAEIEVTTARETLQAKRMAFSQGVRVLALGGPSILWYLTKGRVGISPDKFVELYELGELFDGKTEAQVEEMIESAPEAAREALREKFRQYRSAVAGGAAASSAGQKPPAKGRPSDAIVVVFGQKLYGELVENQKALATLARPLLGGETWQNLGDAGREAVGAIVLPALAAVEGGSACDQGAAGAALWNALRAAAVGELSAVARAVSTQADWSALDRGVKVAIFGVAAALLGALDLGSSENRENQASPAGAKEAA